MAERGSPGSGSSSSCEEESPRPLLLLGRGVNRRRRGSVPTWGQTPGGVSRCVVSVTRRAAVHPIGQGPLGAGRSVVSVARCVTGGRGVSPRVRSVAVLSLCHVCRLCKDVRSVATRGVRKGPTRRASLVMNQIHVIATCLPGETWTGCSPSTGNRCSGGSTPPHGCTPERPRRFGSKCFCASHVRSAAARSTGFRLERPSSTSPAGRLMATSRGRPSVVSGKQPLVTTSRLPAVRICARHAATLAKGMILSRKSIALDAAGGGGPWQAVAKEKKLAGLDLLPISSTCVSRRLLTVQFFSASTPP